MGSGIVVRFNGPATFGVHMRTRNPGLVPGNWRIEDTAKRDSIFENSVEEEARAEVCARQYGDCLSTKGLVKVAGPEHPRAIGDEPL